MIVKFTFCQIPPIHTFFTHEKKNVHFLHLHLKFPACLAKLATPYPQYHLRARPREEVL